MPSKKSNQTIKNHTKSQNMQNILGRMRDYEFCTYVRSLANQMNAVIHGCMNRSPGYTPVQCVVVTCT